jgi:MOSC domain-containing protein YiiM
MGRVHQINASNGGVPKLPIEHAEVGERGIIGDEQADKVHHGHPDQALCLFSLEVIERFQSEGHPIESGSAGENITVAGVDWAEVVPGRRMMVGPVEIEVTHYATPCSKNARWFVDGRYNRMHENRHPGESRVYARVISGGVMRAGDAVELLG